MTAAERVPVLDVTSLAAGGPDTALVRSVADACAEWGFFQIVGHGIAESRLDAFLAQVRRFFALPRAAKRALERTADNARGYYDRELTKQHPDWKEIFDFGHKPRPDLADDHPANRTLDGYNRWPTGLPGFREAMTRHFAACETLALRLLETVCLGLGLPGDRLHAAFAPHTSFLRLNCYPACPDAAPPDAPAPPPRGLRLGIHHHTDAGALTLLVQDDAPGLQVRRDGRWVTIEPLRGALVVNAGDMLQVWSNDRYASPLHRVLAHAAGPRYSAPFFFNPSYTTVCEPLEGAVDAAHPPRYLGVPWGEFRKRRADGDYADLGEEVQIAHYRAA